MADSREYIAFIHGMGVKEPEEYLEKLMSGMRGYCDGKGLQHRSLDDGEMEGSGRRSLETRLRSGVMKTGHFRKNFPRIARLHSIPRCETLS